MRGAGTRCRARNTERWHAARGAKRAPAQGKPQHAGHGQRRREACAARTRKQTDAGHAVGGRILLRHKLIGSPALWGGGQGGCRPGRAVLLSLLCLHPGVEAPARGQRQGPAAVSRASRKRSEWEAEDEREDAHHKRRVGEAPRGSACAGTVVDASSATLRLVRGCTYLHSMLQPAQHAFQAWQVAQVPAHPRHVTAGTVRPHSNRSSTSR